MQSKDLVSRLEKCYTGAVYDVLREKGMKNTILPHRFHVNFFQMDYFY